MKTYYRVCNLDHEKGLWYDLDGTFTGLIHEEYKFLAASELPMPKDKELVGWLSAVEELEHLWQWFNKDEVKKLQEDNFFIHVFEAEKEKFYEPYQHLVIEQKTAIPVRKIIIL
jgi:hypothetical protein